MLMKKTIAAIVSIFILLSMGACSSNSQEAKIEDIDLVQALEPVDIHFYTMDYGSGESEKMEEVNNMLEQVRLELKDTIKVNPKFHWIKYDEFENKLEELINSGEPVDAIASYGAGVLTQKKMLLDLVELFPKYAPNYYKELESGKINKDALYYASMDDKLYSIPNNWVDSPRYFIAARKDLVDKYSPKGFETFEDYGSFMELVKKNEKDILPGIVNGYDFFQAYVKGNGYYTSQGMYFYSSLKEQSMEIYPIERLGEFTQAFQLLKKWKTEEYVAQRHISTLSEYSVEYTFHNGKLASQLFDMRMLHNNIQNIVSDYEYSIYPLYMKSTQLLNPSTSGIALSKGCKVPERVLMFIEWLHSSQQAYDLFMYGVKDRNYMQEGEKLKFPYEMDMQKKMLAERIDSSFFKDFRYERPYAYEPDNSKDIYLKACTENVITSRQLYKKLGIDVKAWQKDEKKMQRMQKIQKEFESIKTVFDKYFANMNEFIKLVDENDFAKTPDILIEDQRGIGVDAIIEFNSKTMKEFTQ